MESVVKYLNRYVDFCLICLEKHSEHFTEVELEKLKNKCDEISKRCGILIKRMQ